MSEEALRIAHDYFRSRRGASWASAYLAGRGLPEPVQRRFELGYAPPAWRTVTGLLLDLGFGEQQILAAGLARRSRHGRLYDLFRDRVMFPIRDAKGRLAGFIGRTADGVGGPRYLNSPDGPHFRKSELLYTPAGTVRGRPVLVEGPLDALAVRMAGRPAFAPCGTRLSAGQAAQLGSDGVLVALDADPAGQRGTVQAWRFLARLPGRMGAVELPPGRDPADLLAQGGPAAVRDALDAEVPLADVVVDAAMAGHPLQFVEGQVAAAHAAAAVIARMRPEEVARQVARTSSRLGFDAEDITAYVVSALAGADLSTPPRRI